LASADPFGFGGQFGYYTDSETGLQLCQHRYYDSSTGRFVNRDPIGYGGGLNLYAYCANNSVNRADPGGFNPFKVHPTTDAGYMSPVRSYLIDIPAGFDVLAVASKFGQDAKSTPPIILFFRENSNGAKNDFKIRSAPNDNPDSLHQRGLAGNFVFGAEAAAAGWSLDAALGGGDNYRRFGSRTKILKDSFDGIGINLSNDLLHPLDEQQAIQDGFFWYGRNKSPKSCSE